MHDGTRDELVRRRKRDDDRTTETRQAEQARLVEDARHIPGVAEAIEVAQRIDGRVGSVIATLPVVRYASGTNG